MELSQTERNTLRSLAQQVAEIAHLPVQDETRRLWRSLNDLHMERPMVMLDQFPWHELDPDGELVLSVQDPYWRSVEDALRKLLFC